MVDVQEAKSSKMVFNFKKRFFSLLICLFGLGAHAQKINFSGVIRDSLQQPLAGSSLVAINQETNALDAYTITTEDGIFALQLQARKKYKIQISALGLQTLNEELTTEEKDIQKAIFFFSENAEDPRILECFLNIFFENSGFCHFLILNSKFLNHIRTLTMNY